MQHFQEEVEILGQEFRNATRGFGRMDQVWTSLAADAEGNPGAVAYACQKAKMFRRMADECRSTFQKAGGKWPAEGTSLADHIWAERPVQTVDWSAAVGQDDSDDSD